MAFKISRFLNRSTTEIQIQFSSIVSSRIGIPNISVKANATSTLDLTVKSVVVDDNIITITVSPQAPYALYYILLSSTEDQNFVSEDGEFLQEDGLNNRIDFIGLEGPSDVRDSLIDNLSPLYDTENDTVVRKHLASLAKQIQKSKYDIRTSGTGNYISVEVIDEIHTRGFNSADRLSNEGVYEITRVGLTPTGTTTLKNIEFNLDVAIDLLGNSDRAKANDQLIGFPADPFSLRMTLADEIVSNEEILNNKFDNTTLTLSKNNVVQINSLVLIRGDDEFVYDIPRYGYSISNNRYDTGNARTLLTLEDNQIKLSDTAILVGGFPIPSGTDEIRVTYYYLDNGVNVDGDTIEIYQIKQAIRETVGPFFSIFYLEHFPIVSESGVSINVDGVEFLDPGSDNGDPFTQIHPAFETEILYSPTRLPANPGEYSINYSNGQVFVYGASIADGTGAVPPVATYFYKKSFIQNLDYTFDPDTDEVAANSTRNLIGEEVNLAFRYEQVLASGIDYLPQDHIEVLNEQVENRLVSTFRIATKNSPITDVFEIFNETTGETYSVTRFDDNYITFAGRNAPSTDEQIRESITFKTVVGETILISDELFNTGSLKLVKITLENDLILGSSGDVLGSNINSSVSFSLPDIFQNEFYFDSIIMTLSQNLSKISNAGDYIIDYEAGEVYLITSSDTTDFGEINYSYSVIDTLFKNILSPSGSYYSSTNNSDVVLDLTVDSFTTEDIKISGLLSAERFLTGDDDRAIVFGSKLNGIAGQHTVNSTTFIALDGRFDSSHADGNHILRFPDDSERTVVSVVSETEVIVDVAFTTTDRSVSWNLIDFNLTDNDGYNVSTTYPIQFVRGVYAVSDLQTLNADSLINIYDATVDTFEDNVITFNNAIAQGISPGTALIVDYSIGNVYVDYSYVADNIRVSYEYGDNSVGFSIGDTVRSGDQYYVSYKYGALREQLLTNFGSLTQIDELTNFPVDFDREVYRGAVAGALQSFVEGPTVDSISNVVSSITKVDPTITELSFNEWTADRDNLYLQSGKLVGAEEYGDGKYGFGLIIDDEKTLSFPGEAYISLKDGTFESWMLPQWRGIDNDSTLSFDIGRDNISASEEFDITDGYIGLNDIFIGSAAFSPDKIPFTLSRFDDPSPIGRPSNFANDPGYYIWFDDIENIWNVRMVAGTEQEINFTGSISSTGSFTYVKDGYSQSNIFVETNEVNDSLTSIIDELIFSTIVDGYDIADGYDGYIGFDGYDGYGDGYLLFEDGFSFISDDTHYVFDTGTNVSYNRISMFKDGSGFLNIRVYDNYGKLKPGKSRFFNIAHDITDWAAGEAHHVAASWRLNSPDDTDELHLFVDGQEVNNLFKYGGHPSASNTSIFRTEAQEFITLAATKNIIGYSDGISVASSTSFTSEDADFVASGIVAGDTFTILDNTADASISRTVVSVIDQNTLQLSASFLLSLENINFSVNQLSFTTETALDVEDFAVFKTDLDGYTTELDGIDATDPDYTIDKDGQNNIININKDIDIGDAIYITTLGLKVGRERGIIYKYDGDYIFNTNLAPPSDLEDVDIYKLIMKRFAIVEDGYMDIGPGHGDGRWVLSGSQLDGYFSDVPQPTNLVNGKQLKITLGGTNNINFAGTNRVIIEGTTFGGSTSETVIFTDYGSEITSNYFTSIGDIHATFTGNDTDLAFGSLEIIENVSLTRQENNGDYGQAVSYNNGQIGIVMFGSGGMPYNQFFGFYLFDYPTRLRISIDEKGPLFIGSDINGQHQIDSTIDSVIFLNEMLSDVRTGEDPDVFERTITSDYISLSSPEVTAQTLMLLNFDNSLENEALPYTTYGEDVLTNGNSVNASFGDCAVFYDHNPLIIDNGPVVIDPDEGSIEFWISPFIDIYNDTDNVRYYVDASTLATENVLSTTKTTVILTKKSRRVDSVRLITDDGTGTNFFDNGELSIDGVTITLGSSLPAQFTRVRISYLPVDFAGDRLSIYKDGYNELNFEILASEKTYKISYPISWQRNTWHRIMATWDLNNQNNQDRIRLFIDGIEGGTILYGTPGLLYGIGVLYGSAAVGSLGSDFLTTNINLNDTFGTIAIGGSFDGLNSSRARIDNLRFSKAVREPATVADMSVDLNFNANISTVSPVVEDAFTSALYDFDKDPENTGFLSNLLAESTPLFHFDIDVIDSFDIVSSDDRIKTLISDLIERVKPAHTSAFISFKE